MRSSRCSRSVTTAVVLAVAFLIQGTWALAGSTGGLNGTVTDGSGSPVAGARVTTASPSQTASTQTDARGHFVFFGLSPDTYTVTAEKEGLTPASIAGVTVFADNQQTLSLQLTKVLKTIAKVSSRATGNLVKSGTSSSVYSVNATQAAQVASSAGGYNLDTAYSAIASQPGVYEPIGSFNFGQVFYIRGSSYGEVGYEFDGVPVNRAFDNYSANSLSNLGTSETEVYTGGSPAGGGSSTLGGYINQVIKSGTYPGYGNAVLALGAPAFYHKIDLETGGANPARTFSWYAAVRGSDNVPSFIDDNDGAGYNPDGSNAAGLQGSQYLPVFNVEQNFFGNVGNGPWPTCVNGVAPPGSPRITYDGADGGGLTGTPICAAYGPLAGSVAATGFGGGAYGFQSQDRENVFNFHFALPHKNDDGRDDIQLLYDAFAYHSIGWDNINTSGGLPLFEQALTGWAGPGGYLDTLNGGLPSGGVPQWPGGSTPNICSFEYFYAVNFGLGTGCAAAGQSPFEWGDGLQFTGVAFGTPASSAAGKVVPYYFPGSPTNRSTFVNGGAGYGISPNQPSGVWNDGQIFKVQYTKNIGSNAFVRLFGYSFYSDWLQNNPNFGTANLPIFDLGQNASGNDYEVNYHTKGVQLEGSDQINSQHLLTLTGNYTTSTGQRWNNTSAGVSSGGSPAAVLMNGKGACISGIVNDNGNGNQTPYDASYPDNMPVGSPVSCLSYLAGAYLDSGGNPQAAVVSNVGNGVLPAAPAGATWTMAQNLQINGNRNSVTPKFGSLALTDEFRPNDKLYLNLGLRFENYRYDIPISGDAESTFWVNEVNQTACVAPVGLVQVPGSDNNAGNQDRTGSNLGYTTFLTTAPGGTCPFDNVIGQQTYHPGTNGIPAISLGTTPVLQHSTLSPRFGGTYTLNPDTVVRFTFGRYTQPTPTYAEQVLTYTDGYTLATNLYNSAYFNNGFASTIHDNPIQYSNNADLSLEKHLKGTDITFRLTPFYRYTSNQVVSVSLPGGLAGGFNSGTQRSQGIEFQIDKGDPSANGWSSQLSYTYTDVKIKYSLINGNNYITGLQNTLNTFLNLTKTNGGSPCYNAGTGETAAQCAADPAAVTNPYYNVLPGVTPATIKSQFAVDGWYPVYSNYFPNGVAGGDAGTAIPKNIFAGFLAYKRGKWQASLNAALQQGNLYGAPNDVVGIDPTSCQANLGTTGVVAGSQQADFQSCTGQVVIPNPVTGQFDGIAQYTNPWILNIGGAINYEISPKVSITASLANLYNQCFGGTSAAWTAAFKPSSIVCNYGPNSGQYLGWSPGEAYNTAGAGYFNGASPSDPVNGTTHYPNGFNYPYTPFAGGYPFQAYIELKIKL
ncbi:MAG: TonB-dependent receptor [Candidatus Baltobacteraceae bacterium]